LFELAVQKVPTICIPAIEHQIPYAESFMAKGFSINLGLWDKVKGEKIRNTVIQILNNTKKRKRMNSIGSRIIDGKGLSRVIEIIETLTLDGN